MNQAFYTIEKVDYKLMNFNLTIVTNVIINCCNVNTMLSVIKEE